MEDQNLEEESKEEAIASSLDFEEESENDISFLFDLPMEVAAEIGQVYLTLRELLSMQEGSILTINKLAGEPLDVLINNKVSCKAEVIVINEKYGVRMTDLIDPDENLEYQKTSQG